jgi:hypothetical protein
MSRFVLLGLLLGAVAAAVTGCQSAEKKEAVGAAEETRWKMPRYIIEDNWWGRNEMGGLDR